MHRSGRETLLAVLVLCAGCSTPAAAPPPREITALEYRWGAQGEWSPLGSLNQQPPGRGGATALDVRFTLPAVDCIDPAVMLTQSNYLKQANIAGRAAALTGGLFPVLTSEAGKTVELRFESTQLMREGTIFAGCHSALRRFDSSSDIGALWVAFALIGTGIALGVLALRGGAEARLLASCALFCSTVGLLTFQQTSTSHELSPVPLPALRAVRDVAAFIYPGAFAAFVGFAVPKRGRWLFIGTYVMTAALAAAVAADLAGLYSLRASARFAALLTLGIILAVPVHLARNAKPDASARTRLVG
ncbi:MAG: hypothetical protein JNK82_41490, partial [Myxococcaceae bacterium]|nr:hypothetical protein [Myxococcaceae bacterium]